MVDRPSVAEELAERVARIEVRQLPGEVRDTCERLLIDVAGLCVAARATDYVKAADAAWPDAGPATVIGLAETRSAAGAAFINGTAAHGEDFDDTFEGGPVHASAVVVPAVLAAAEQEGLSGAAALVGIAVGAEVMCRLSLVAPKAVHKAGFHPTAVFGAMGAAVGVGAALQLKARQLVDAMGIAGSMASGIIEYLADGSWTKRMHPGWAAQSGLRAALLGRAGFTGPRTVFEGVHGLFHGFAHTRDGNYGALLDGFGERWVMQTLAFKPYPCGTMMHPYIDCARRLHGRIDGDEVVELVCEVGEGTVHRLWEPLAEKQRPPNGYAAKFATPYGIAVGIVKGDVGLDAFSDAAVGDPAVRALAAKVRYEIDPANPYPSAYTGHIRARLRDGRVIEERQPHLRGGAREPLSRAELEAKAAANLRSGGWTQAQVEPALALARNLWDGPVDLALLRM
jgi:2-methylcitrate dehydratase PrpD